MMKAIFLGSSTTGKSMICKRIGMDDFSASYEPTIGVDFCLRELDIEGEKVRLQLWDTAGQERFRSLVATYYRGANILVAVYDVTSKASLSVATTMLTQAQGMAPKDAVCALLGNKIDLGDAIEVDSEQGREAADGLGAEFFECSAKTGQGAVPALEALAGRVLGGEGGGVADKDKKVADKDTEVTDTES